MPYASAFRAEIERDAVSGALVRSAHGVTSQPLTVNSVTCRKKAACPHLIDSCDASFPAVGCNCIEQGQAQSQLQTHLMSTPPANCRVKLCCTPLPNYACLPRVVERRVRPCVQGSEV